jgi:hypothetical protein
MQTCKSRPDNFQQKESFISISLLLKVTQLLKGHGQRFNSWNVFFFQTEKNGTMYVRSDVDIKITDRQNVDKMTENVDLILVLGRAWFLGARFGLGLHTSGVGFYGLENFTK